MGENRITHKRLVLSVVVLSIIAAIFIGSAKKAGGSESDAQKAQKACASLGQREKCYAKYFEGVATKNDVPYSFEVLRKLQEKDPQARGCHFIAHSISYATVKKDVSRWKEIMNTSPVDCSYGGVHGALEYYASTFPNGRIPKSQIGSLCNNPDINNCSHGLGHILLVMNENDIAESATECEALPQGDFAKFECLSGVFMERITALNLEAHGLIGKEALNWPARIPELERLCREQSGMRSLTCWKEIVHAIAVAFDNDMQSIVDFCETASSSKEKLVCIDHSFGVIAGSYGFELPRMRGLCEAQSEVSDFKSRCYHHLVSATLSTLPGEIGSATDFCNSLNEAYKENCLVTVKGFAERQGGSSILN